MSRQLKSMCGTRETLLGARTQLINNARGWMRTAMMQMRGGSTSTFHDRLRARALADGITIPTHIEAELVAIGTLTVQLRTADQELKAFAKQHPVCRQLMTIPGVGPVTAVRFLAALDDVRRFPNAHSVAAYLGLTPGEHSSSERQRRTGITKAWPRAVRRTLIQAAWSAFRTATNDPMVRWAEQIALRRGKFVAIVALARKMTGVMYALWRDGTTYRPTDWAPTSN